MSNVLKRNQVFVFDDGTLTIKMDGHGQQNGWSELSFHDRQVEVDADGYHVVEIPPSELAALRDFLNLVIPKAPAMPVGSNLLEGNERG